MQLADGVLRLLVPRTRVTASSADIFVLWMIGSSLVLIAISVLFLRNQVKPIERLAAAAEAFGKGRPVADFKPRGATEVRKASAAFIQMRERIDRFVQQRTDMLAGISHDLKTPLASIASVPRLLREHRAPDPAENELLGVVERAGTALAFPTQTVHVGSLPASRQAAADQRTPT